MKKYYLALLLLYLLTYTCFSQIPAIINYQGYVVDAAGKPVDGQQSVTFNIYDNAFSNTPVWSEEHSIKITNGGLNINLGSKKSFSTANLKFDKPYWLGIKVGSGGEFPKIQVTSVPYSFTAQNVLGKNAKEGYVLTWRDSASVWEAGSGITFPFSQTISTNENGFLLKQTGNAPTMTLSRVYNTGIAEKKEGDNPQGIYENIAQFLSSKADILAEVNSDQDMIAGSFSTFYSEKNKKPTVYIYNDAIGECTRIEKGATLDNESVAFNVINKGLGITGAFYNDPDKYNNPNPTVDIFSNGRGECLRVIKNKNTGGAGGEDGSVALFQLLNKENNSDAFVVATTGKGRAGIFTINNTSNINTALVGQSNGNGGSCISAYTEAENTLGGNFQIHNSNSTAYALQVLSNGTKEALFVETYGVGSGAVFSTKGDFSVPEKAAPAVLIKNSGAGVSRIPLFVMQENQTARCAEFYSNDKNNTEICLSVFQNGSGTAFYAEQAGSSSDSPVLWVRKEGTNANWAGLFEGNVWVKGKIEKSSGNFKIDHPLDPENKFLVHSFVESPEMKNIYDGIAVLDERGEATVIMPEWFDALNKDFRYQLTCIGGFAQVYIAEEMNGNQFKIAGGRPGLKVSWMVTGVRHDPYAEANPVVVEQIKNDKDKGRYIFPSLYNKPESQAIGYEMSNMKPSKMEVNDVPFKVNNNVEEVTPEEFKAPDTTLLKPERVANNKETK